MAENKKTDVNCQFHSEMLSLHHVDENPESQRKAGITKVHDLESMFSVSVQPCYCHRTLQRL